MENQPFSSIFRFPIFPEGCRFPRNEIFRASTRSRISWGEEREEKRRSGISFRKNDNDNDRKEKRERERGRKREIK